MKRSSLCSSECLDFVATACGSARVRGKHVVEVGSYDANGSPRGIIESLKPAEYVGVDIAFGPGVDVVCAAEHLVERFGAERFDGVVTTEMLEHVRDWRTVVSNLKRILRPGGWLVLTTRSVGFEYHGWPYDFWRFELDDMRLIFADFEDLQIGRDPGAPGVLVQARKPLVFEEATLDALALNSIVLGRRSLNVSDRQLQLFKAKTRATRARRSVTGHIPERQRATLKRALPWLVSAPTREGAGPLGQRAEPSSERGRRPGIDAERNDALPTI